MTRVAFVSLLVESRFVPPDACSRFVSVSSRYFIGLADSVRDLAWLSFRFELTSPLGSGLLALGRLCGFGFVVIDT